MTVAVLAVAAGPMIGLSLGALGGGGSILAVPGLAHLGWAVIACFTVAAVAGVLAGGRLTGRASPQRLSTAFTVLIVAVAGYTLARSLPSLV